MGNVVGPFNTCEWDSMLKLRESVKDMRRLNADKFRNAITKQTKILKVFYGREAA